MRNLVFIYAALLVYGSLYPFGWGEPSAPMLAFLHGPLPSHWDRGDVVQNILVYMPFGLALVAWWSKRHSYWSALLLATVCGTLLSFFVEFVQQWLPARVPSLLDILMNWGGSLIGGLLAALVRRDTSSGGLLLGYRDRWIRPEPLANVGLATLGLWILAQTSPMVPSLDIAHLRHGLGQLWRQLADPGQLDLAKLASLAGFLIGLGLLTRALVLAGKPFLHIYAGLLAFVLACKLLVEGRVLSLELVLAAGAALPAVALMARLRIPAAACSGVAMLTAAIVVYELTPAVYAGTAYDFNWIPFLGQMSSLNGFENILEFLWPFMAMACLARYAAPRYRHDAIAIGGTLTVALGMLGLEWMQLSVPGRAADITQVLLSCAGWMAPWCVAERGRRHTAASVQAAAAGQVRNVASK